MPKAKAKKQIKVRDLKPANDAKGGGSYTGTYTGSKFNPKFLGTTPH